MSVSFAGKPCLGSRSGAAAFRLCPVSVAWRGSAHGAPQRTPVAGRIARRRRSVKLAVSQCPPTPDFAKRKGVAKKRPRSSAHQDVSPATGSWCHHLSWNGPLAFPKALR